MTAPLGPRDGGLRQGDCIEHFRIEAKIGQGGMGVVYRAIDERLCRLVALKVLPALAGDDPERRKRFLREARAAGAVTHANIATIYEVGEVDGRIFIAMELVEGRTLRKVMEAEPLSVQAALRIARRVGLGLAKAHDRGIVHRDLKPDNVMISDDLEVKLLDFGLAKLLDPPTSIDTLAETVAHATETTQVGKILGTPGYMSPEQARGAALDLRADIFSLGIILYEMVTGARPFSGDSTMDVIIAISRDPHVPASKVNPEVPPELDGILDRCLAKKPSDRYANVRELLAAIEPLLVASATESIAPARGPRPGPRPESSAVSTAAGDTTLVGRPRQPRRAALGVVIATVLASSLVIGLVLRSRVGSTGPTTAASVAPSASAGALGPASVVDLPLPSSTNPEALAAYKQALLAYRAADTGRYLARLEQALSLDPLLAAAQLRIALESLQSEPTRAREAFQGAMAARATLSPRDRALLSCAEPYVLEQPANLREMARRLEAAVVTYPRDAELRLRLAYARGILGENAPALSEVARATELDPDFVRAWTYQSSLEMQLPEAAGDLSKALASAAACLERIPGSAGCLTQRAELEAFSGACDAMEGTARRLIAAAPSAHAGYGWLAAALFARGRPVEGVREALAQAAARRDPADRAAAVSDGASRLALATGDFPEAERLARERTRAVQGSTDRDAHAAPARVLVEVLREQGKVAEAGRVASDYLRLADVWTSRSTPDGWSVEADPAPLMLAAAYAAKALPESAFEARREEWARDWRSKLAERWHGFVWWTGYARLASSPAAARAALAVAPDERWLRAFMRMSPGDGDIGKVYLYAGDLPRAERHLVKLTQSCVALLYPLEHTRALLELGRLREAQGDAARACSAYRAVLARWGSGSAKSVTASAASAARRALADCK